MANLIASTILAGGIVVQVFDDGTSRIDETVLTAEAGLDLVAFLAEQTSAMNARLIEDYGPMAHASEHRRGQHIRYALDRVRNASGTILWVCAPMQVEERTIGLRYVVAPDEGGFIDVVFPADVLEHI